MYGIDREQIERVDEYLKESPAVAEVVPSYAMLVSIEARRNPKSKLTFEVIDQICHEVAQGATQAECCRVVGIAVNTLERWRRLGRKNLSSKEELNEYGILVEGMRLAAGQWATRLARRIEHHGEEDWRALAWLLERVLPEEFGQDRGRKDYQKGIGASIRRINQELLDEL